MHCKSIKTLSRILLMFVFISAVSVIAQGKEQLIIIGHRVHKAIAGGKEGGGRNLIKDFEEKHNVEIIYQTYPNPKVHEKLVRLGPLTTCAEDIFYVLDAWMVKEEIAQFLEPLDSYLNAKPIEGFPQNWAPSMVEAGTVEGSRYLVPIRAGNWALWYNKKVFDERGIAGPPKTPEELYETAQKITYTRPTGEKIFGWCSRGTIGAVFEIMAMMVRMWEGEVITPDFKVTINEAPAIKTLQLLRRMFKEGIMPPDWPRFEYAENVKTWQEGRVAMGLVPSNYYFTLNDPEKSKIAGNAVPALIPLAREFWTDKRDFAIGSSWFWSQGILKGSQEKDLAWEYIRFLASRESHFSMARSGNPTPRVDLLRDSEYLAINPGAAIEAKVAPFTRGPIPAFPKMAEAEDVIGEHVHNVVVLGKSPQDEMDKAAEKIRALLP